MTIIEQREAVLYNAQFYLSRLSAEVHQLPIGLLSGETIGEHRRYDSFGVILSTLTYRKAILCAK